MTFTRNQFIILGVVGAAVLVLALLMAGLLPGLKSRGKSQSSLTGIDLELWGVFDSATNYRGVFDKLNKTYPGVKINYRGFNDVKEYEATLLEALASQKGPDVFMIPANGLYGHLNKIFPLPQEKLPLAKIRRLFPKIVEQDFVPLDTAFALPLYIDTLALIYNKDLFNQAAVIEPGATWEEFKNIIPKLTKLDSKGRLVQAGAAIGGSAKSIDKAADLLSLLMLQYDTKMVSDDFQAAIFASQAGLTAFNFYTQFVNPTNSLYTWHDGFPYSIDAVSQGKAAIIFNYASALPKIKSKNAFIDVRVAAVPQREGADFSISYPNYWGYTVSRQSNYPNLAWDIIIKLTTDEEVAESYLAETKRPPALNSLINKYLNDPDLGVFARQALIARSWQQADPIAIEEIFSRMIEGVISGARPGGEALKIAESQVTQLMSRRFSN